MKVAALSTRLLLLMDRLAYGQPRAMFLSHNIRSQRWHHNRLKFLEIDRPVLVCVHG